MSVYLVDTCFLAVAFVADGTTATDSFVPGSDPCIASVGLFTRISCQYRDDITAGMRRLAAFAGSGFDNSLFVESVDYVKQYGNVSNQVIRFGENLLDLKKYSKAEDIKTAIIPVGKDNVTITTANGHNGTDYVYSQDAVDLYGWIYDKVDFSEVYDPDKLLEEANKYLQKCINLAITIELTAVDLHMIDVDINAIRLGDLVPCISTQHGIMSTFGNPDTYYLVSKYELDLENPANNKITLGRTISTLTDKQVQSSQNLETKINEVRTEMYNISGNDMEPITNETLEGLLN